MFLILDLFRQQSRLPKLQSYRSRIPGCWRSSVQGWPWCTSPMSMRVWKLPKNATKTEKKGKSRFFYQLNLTVATSSRVKLVRVSFIECPFGSWITSIAATSSVHSSRRISHLLHTHFWMPGWSSLVTFSSLQHCSTGIITWRKRTKAAHGKYRMREARRAWVCFGQFLCFPRVNQIEPKIINS